jgi:predicted permease
MPVAVNVFILAAEYNQDTRLASQTIFWTTALSAVTLTGWLALMH